jgi:hypothetical protein
MTTTNALVRDLCLVGTVLLQFEAIPKNLHHYPHQATYLITLPPVPRLLPEVAQKLSSHSSALRARVITSFERCIKQEMPTTGQPLNYIVRDVQLIANLQIVVEALNGHYANSRLGCLPPAVSAPVFVRQSKQDPWEFPETAAH